MFMVDSVVINVKDQPYQVKGGDTVATLSFDGYVDNDGVSKLMDLLADEIYQSDSVKFEVTITGTNC
jgi:hypothetical protein